MTLSICSVTRLHVSICRCSLRVLCMHHIAASMQDRLLATEPCSILFVASVHVDCMTQRTMSYHTIPQALYFKAPNTILSIPSSREACLHHNPQQKVSMCAGGLSAVSPGRGEEEAQQSSKQAPPSLTPHRKPANRTAALRSSWSHPASVSPPPTAAWMPKVLYVH